MQYDVIIIGAGAAGMMCAIEAGKRGRRVLLLDHSASIGEKIRISGGGRCNFTNLHTTPDHYLSQNPYFCVSALTRYTQHDFIKLVESYNIAYHEKTLGQLFCDGSSTQIIDMLLQECETHQVTLAANTTVQSVTKQPEGFMVTTEDKNIESQSLVIATGGLSIPKIGATGFGYDIAKQFDIAVIEPRAALVPLTLEGKTLKALQSLSGISVESIVTCNNVSFKEALLFTHRGLSGPSILQISSYWKEHTPITINLVPDKDVLSILKEYREHHPKQDISSSLATLLPKRLAQYICTTHHYQKPMAELSNDSLQSIANTICEWSLIPDGTEGYRTAEVTLGGIDTNALSSKTCESKDIPGLYFIGEVVDVTGHLGGFNFQWAWSSGYAAGQYV